MPNRRAIELVTLLSGAVDTTAPTVASFTVPAYANTLTVTITAFTASEAGASFIITESSSPPAVDAAGWSATAQTEYTAADQGTRVLYPWVKDAAGNVSSVYGSPASVVFVTFVLRDDFTDTVAAGAVNGTSATPTGGTRTATDTGSKLSIDTGVAHFASGGVGAGNPGLWYAQIARGAGKILLAKILHKTSDLTYFSFDINQSGSPSAAHAFYIANTTLNVYDNSGLLAAAAIVANTTYYFAIVMRATGAMYYIKGGTFTNWTLIYTSITVNAAMYPALADVAGSSNADIDFIRLPVSTFVNTPLASDAFTRADGVLGNTGGGGSEESGGNGLAWTAQLGTWGVATNKAACSALDGGTSLGIATVNASNTNVMISSVITRSVGSMGAVCRYTDANNYIKATYDGTNWTIIEVVSGTPSTILANTAATYGATKRTVLSVSASKIRLYYGDVFVGEATTNIASGNNHGLFTTDTGATFDDFVVFSKGLSNEYSALDAYINP